MIQYAVKMEKHDKSGTVFIDIYPSTIQVSMCIEPGTPVYPVDVAETDNPTEDSYWAWKDPDGDIGLVFHQFFLMDMCFPDGSAAEERAGRGKVIRVNVKEIKR